jgi:predicted metal-dependent enzyme (double-stranded beta helix superfamily)
MAVETDAYYVQSPLLYSFIEEVRRVMATEPDRAKTVQLLRPAFAVLLADHTWLPDEFLQPDVAGGMGGGIGSYLIYRSTNGDLSLSSLVLPAGATTPVHDHLAWGLVGLYSGEQDEWVYRRLDTGGDEGTADLVEVERRHLHPGDFYELLPPEGDIHRVQASDTGPSVSLHLLGNDIGCVWRHRFEPELKRVQLFRSSYSNQPCPDTERV